MKRVMQTSETSEALIHYQTFNNSPRKLPKNTIECSIKNTTLRYNHRTKSDPKMNKILSINQLLIVVMKKWQKIATDSA